MPLATATLEETREFWPSSGVYDGIDVTFLLADIRQFALNTFDLLDQNSNCFISSDELKLALKWPQLSLRETNYILFLLSNEKTIGLANDDHDDISPCGLRKEILGISRLDLVEYFDRLSAHVIQR